ncbi:MAG: diaminopimelate decarboxylase [Rikenellaceae bacterium]|jgi:diaminopimelate decarboxylase|nr:diaminopimelate decarboxylase [Rikenellaceae bacterium]
MYSRRVKQALEGLQTPFYLYDMELLRRTVGAVVAASSPHGYKVHYAIKANFERPIVAEIIKAGLGVDCVSGNEVRYAIEQGCPARSVVFAGVGKSDREIEYALQQGIFAFNCESRHELDVINEIAGRMGVVADVALRINPDVDPLTHKHTSTGHADSKFGISYKEVDEVVERLPQLKNVRITGLHFHIGSQITDLRVYEYLCRRANTLVAWFVERGFSFLHINLGGGLGIDYLSPDENPVPDFAAFFDIFARNLELPAGLEVHFELGRSIVGQCGELISRVLYNKTTAEGTEVAIIDAGMTELIRPALYQAVHSIENLSGEGRPEREYMIAGPVCESSDTFARGLRLSELRRGDLVTLKSAGAYGTAMASRYNMHDLPGSVYSDTL